MPHDSKGQVIAKGDTVTMTLEVTEVFPGEGACNAYFKGLHNATSGDESPPTVVCNTKFATKVDTTPGVEK